MEAKTTLQLVVRTATQSTEPTEEQTATQKVTRSASQVEAQTRAQTVTHAWTDANVQVQTEALYGGGGGVPRGGQKVVFL